VQTLDRYIIRSFIFNYVLSLFVMISMYVTLDLFVNFDEFTEESPPLAVVVRHIASFYGYNLPLYFAQLAGMITLFAAALTLARMLRNNEMTALLASGVSMYRVAAPVLLVGVLVNGLWVVDQEVVIPRIAHKLARPRDDVEGRRVYGVWCLRDGPQRLVSAAKFYPIDRRLARMIVIERRQDGSLDGIIKADLATWTVETNEAGKVARRGWKLARGVRFRPGANAQDVFSPEQDIEPTRVDFYPSDLAPDEIVLRQAAQWMNFLSLGQLGELQRRGVARPEQVAAIRHARFTSPINNMILLILGIVFFLRREPSTVLVQGAKALAVCASCFIIAFVGQNLAGQFTMFPALPAWLPIILFAPLCAVLLDSVRT
jgi:lipopolysaccharide export system permease protein